MTNTIQLKKLLGSEREITVVVHVDAPLCNLLLFFGGINYISRFLGKIGHSLPSKNRSKLDHRKLTHVNQVSVDGGSGTANGVMHKSTYFEQC